MVNIDVCFQDISLALIYYYRKWKREVLLSLSDDSLKQVEKWFIEGTLQGLLLIQYVYINLFCNIFHCSLQT